LKQEFTKLRKGMTMNKEPMDPAEVTQTCCWCGRHIGDDSPLYAIGVKVKPGVDISEYEGGVMAIQMTTQPMQMYAVVTGADSQAKSEGKDLMFVLCSEECGEDLKNFLNSEILMGEMFESVE
jgi:hypothetical protein